MTASAARRTSRLYLTRALGRKPGWFDVWRHFYAFAVVSVDRLFFLSGRYANYQVQVNGSELFQRYLTRKQGCILLVSHIGSFDVMRVAGVKEHDLPN